MRSSGKFEECHLDIENKPLSNVCLSDDSDDSDQRQLFELPKRKIVRPPSSSFKKRLGSSKKSCCSKAGLCCKVCTATFIPLFVVSFIFASVICLSVLMVGVSGIKREVDILKIRLSNSEDAEKDFNVKRDQLRKDFQEKLDQLKDHEKRVEHFQSTIQGLHQQMDVFNSSITELQRRPSLSMETMKKDLDNIKSGMADTGSQISKLQGMHDVLEKGVKTLKDDLTESQSRIFNNTVKISELEHSPFPARVTTPETLVVTMAPDEKTTVKREEFDTTISKLREEQQLICQKETSSFTKEFEKLRNVTISLNRTYYEHLTSLRSHFGVAVDQNVTDNETGFSPQNAAKSISDGKADANTVANQTISNEKVEDGTHQTSVAITTTPKAVASSSATSHNVSPRSTQDSKNSGETELDNLDNLDRAISKRETSGMIAENTNLQTLIDKIHRKKRNG